MITRDLTVVGSNGPIRLELAEAGEGGRPLLLAHGFTGAKEDFGDWIDPLAAEGWHVVAADHRGHGASDQPADEAAYSFEILAGDLLALLDALGWSTAVALGHSMGGMVLQLAYLAAPERFEALILMDTSHRPLKADPGLIELAVAIARTEGMAAVMAAQEAIGAESPMAEGAAAARVLADRPGHKEFNDRKLLGSSPSMYAAIIPAITDRANGFDTLPSLGSVTVPTLVLVGDEDAPFLKPARAMAEAIPDAELVVVPDAGHSPQFENPKIWWEVVTGFLRRL